MICRSKARLVVIEWVRCTYCTEPTRPVSPFSMSVYAIFSDFFLRMCTSIFKYAVAFLEQARLDGEMKLGKHENSSSVSDPDFQRFLTSRMRTNMQEKY